MLNAVKHDREVIEAIDAKEFSDTVLDYCQAALREQGWEERLTSATGITLGYRRQSDGPAFSLGVVIIDTQEGTTTVEL